MADEDDADLGDLEEPAELDDDLGALDDEELADGDEELADGDEELDAEDEGEAVDDGEDDDAGGATATTTDDDDEDEDDDDLDPDDVEEGLDVILKDRLVVVDDEADEEDEEAPEVEERTDGSARVPAKRPGEFVCESCFLLKHRSQLADSDRMLCRDCV